MASSGSCSLRSTPRVGREPSFFVSPEYCCPPPIPCGYVIKLSFPVTPVLHPAKTNPACNMQAKELKGGRRSPLLLFSTNDYLGLSAHPDVRRAASSAATAIGMGVRSAAIVSGHSKVHERLEHELAALKHAQTCLLFPSGFAANLAAITALASDGKVAIFSDELNHASLIDGCRLARLRGASVHVFRHCDYNHLSDLLQHKGLGKRKLVVTDGVFSMDGDCADVQVSSCQLSPICHSKL